MARPDELDEYLERQSALSRAYHAANSPEPPVALDRRVLRMAESPQRRARRRMVFACAACLLLSCVGMSVLLLRAPPSSAVEAPRITRVQYYHEPRAEEAARREQAAWIARIVALRREGHTDEAEAELKRFHAAFPDHTLPHEQ